MPLFNASLHWQDNTPLSDQYCDIYYNVTNGVEESRFVFFDSNEIHKRASFNGSLTIAETGFGTGLNFLLTCSEWKKVSSSENFLTYISVEKFPLRKSDMKKALQQWPLFSDLSQKLLDQYPIACTGAHTLLFPEARTKLILLLGDAAESYSKLKADIDAWYLDGFAPSKNPDMWSPELFEQIARLSHPGTTFSTFTAAGAVRRGLQDVGFKVRKQKGFGRKREMLVGTFIEHKKPCKVTKPWFELPPSKKPEVVSIIGGGLAGCTTARALAERGIKVRLFEKAGQLASAGSGNRQGALYAKLPVRPTKQGDLHLTGFLHSVRCLRQWDPTQNFWQQCGVAQLAVDNKEADRQAELIAAGCYPEELITHKTATELSELAGQPIQHSGLFFPDAGWVSPKELCQYLIAHDNIEIIHADITDLNFQGEHWQLLTAEQTTFDVSHVVLCNAELASQFEQTSHLPLKTIRGQVSITPQNLDLPKLNTVICGAGYISPAKEGQYCFGATFDLKSKTLNVSADDHTYNINTLTTVLPDLAKPIQAAQSDLSGRTAFRCSTPDYMPVVGPAPVYDAYLETFAALRKDKNWRFNDDARASHHPNLHINTGHGSKGLITCPISAELLASMICNEPLPLPKDVIDAINPSRFIIKNLIKQAV